ncbi:MAG: NAD(P)H-dependent oxidoreductase [Porticoccaceae bacterium]
MDILQALHWRYAVKQFSSRRLPDHQLRDLLEATRLSASSYGLQPYQLVVVESMPLRHQLLDYSQGQDKIVHSSHLVVFAAKTDIDQAFIAEHLHRLAAARAIAAEAVHGMAAHYEHVLITEKTAQQRRHWAQQQAYIALGNFLTCAALMGIDTCPMTGISSDDYDRVLGLTGQGLTTSAICAVGERHPADAAALLPKIRRHYDDLVIRMRS